MDSDSITSTHQQEEQQLKLTLSLITKFLQERSSKERYVGDDFTEQVLDDMNEKAKESLQRSLKEPYFGRLDFQELETERVAPYYIGKVGVMNDDNKQPLVIDWRAPLSSMFYGFSGEEEIAFYEAPEGLVEGTLFLKRNIVIREQQLLRVVDSFVKGEHNLEGTDEFLLYKLGERKDNRLRDIVSTIQMEQNQIIRAPKDSALVIQGVAGSGKTTVALHRLAYLLYEYREKVRPERMMIFAPSTMFLDYISDVLPELGVGDIQQSTFPTWVLERLEDEVKLRPLSERYHRRFERQEASNGGALEKPGRYKGSKAFKYLITSYIATLEKLLLPDKEFVAWEGKVINVSTLRNWYSQEYRSYPLAQRKERIIARMKRWIEGELKQIEGIQAVKDYKKTASQRLRTWAKSWNSLSPFDIYQDLFQSTKRTAPELMEIIESIPAHVKEESLATFKTQLIDYEDLAPLLFIQFKLNGFNKEDRFDHVVIDEAQDFSPFQVDLLKELVRGGSFTILGDLAQGIHADQGTLSWKEFQSLFPQTQTSYFELKQSYRSTLEIIEFANHMIDQAQLGVSKAVPVFRSGEPVKVVGLKDKEQLEFLIAWVALMQDKQYQSMAIVTRTEKGARELQQKLFGLNVGTNLIDAQSEAYSGGVSIVPIYLTKGLEFDAVILLNVDAASYPANDLEAKLLYVGCTRALHQLWLTHRETPSSILGSVPHDRYESVDTQRILRGE
ncbi:HelD family protein [Bacillus horti]|uniref:DNA 3'-5' helicase n=1 Tax=Caldalkalibacillus horti TaxID=77523 RepID=A0ABT9VWC0_9BACI|nr:3'-5' exonuclease [Bacillus horti]MDQ0165107.1 DNA helicase-2/ATP-dependent DNA helicase PcrA [Bacillus horti]